jgi:retron-type reverse transcriptase
VAGPSNQGGGYRQAPPRIDPNLPDPYEAHDILGLSPEETRKRSLKINPYATAWIGRVDTIPPQSDERTALIDRGLILRGMLTQDQIREIHRIGDAWLKHHESHKLAKAAAAKSVDLFLEGERQRKLAVKEEKRQAAQIKRADQRKAVDERKKNDIVYLGRDVSARLADRRSNVEALAAAGLPFLATPADVAAALGLSIGELRHLAFHAEAPERTHYVTFEVPKRSGGVRLLASPHKRMRAAQQFIQDQILAKLPLTEQAHGFVPNRSTVSNARLHTQQSLVINLDLKDFFPSITFPRVRGLFESVGYSQAVATILALIVTEAPRMKTEVDGKTLWVAAGDRALPQGACTSPTISNLVARKLDRRLGGLCNKLGVTYSRYADDLTFSLPSKDKVSVGYLFARVRHLVAAEGFAINEAKGRVQRAGGRQEVTGIVVNDGLALRREELKRLRAVLHDAKKHGLEAANRKNHPNFREHLLGKIAYVTMVDPEKGNALRAQFDAL